MPDMLCFFVLSGDSFVQTKEAAGKDMKDETLQGKNASTRPGWQGREHTVMSVRLPGFFSAADHRTIGTLYFVFAIIAGVIGVILSLLVRMEGVGGAYFYRLSAVFFSSAHGLMMIFFMMVPALFCGFGNWLVPLMTGAKDMAFPRLNRANFWLFALSFILFVSVLFCSPEHSGAVVWLISVLHIVALSAVFSAVNFIVTVITMRMPDMTFSRMPLFVWSILIASFLVLMCMPVMAGTVTFWLGGQVLQLQGAAFYNVPQLQIMLWFFSHPEIYVLLLPAFGIISHVVAAFTASPLYAEKAVVAAMAVIGLAGFILWTQNLFDHAGKAGMQTYFYYVLPVIGLPAAFIIFCWFATVRHRQVCWHTPMLWAAGFIFMFVAGAILAFHLALSHAFPGLPRVFVPYFHYIVSLGAVFAIFSGWYFWFPKISGIVIRELTGKVHFWMMFIAVNMIFLPQHFQEFAYEPQSFGFLIMAFAGQVRLSAIGAVMAICSLGVFLYGIAEAFVRKKPAGRNPWGEAAVMPEHFRKKCKAALYPEM